jgi:hypothetical protein
MQVSRGNKSNSKGVSDDSKHRNDVSSRYDQVPERNYQGSGVNGNDEERIDPVFLPAGSMV